MPVRRVSQGSGVMMLTDAEIRELASPRSGCRRRGLALPRAARRVGYRRSVARDRGRRRRRARARRDRRVGGGGAARCRARHPLVPRRRSRGARGRSARCDSGELPASLVLKTSVLLPCANPDRPQRSRSSARRRSTSRPPLAARARRAAGACAAPLDVYVEVPDDQGGFVRFYDVPEIVRLAAPVYVKLGLRNAPNIYPSGLHLEDLAVKLGRERVRRAELVLRLLEEQRRTSSRDAATTARPTWGFPSREREVRGDLHRGARGHPRCPRAPPADAPPSIRPLEQGNAAGRPGVHGPGGPATTDDYDRAIRKVLEMLGDVPAGHVAVYACDQETSAHLGELSVTSLQSRDVAGCARRRPPRHPLHP